MRGIRYFYITIQNSYARLHQYVFPNSSLESRHLLYLQLRKSILESQVLCTDDDLISLGGLAIQSEIGDFQQTVSLAIN